MNNGQPWMLGDVYFGDAEKSLLDWRVEERASDTDDDAVPTPEERRAVVGVLGFDPEEVDKSE